MQTQDKIIDIERQFTIVSASVEATDFAVATKQLAQLQAALQQLFNDASTFSSEQLQQLEQLSERLHLLTAALSEQRQQIKDSLGQIATVKSANKIRKTYQIG